MPEPVLDLLDDAARDLYRAILGEGGRIRVGETRPEDEAALKQLTDLGLLVLRAVDGVYSAMNPRAVSERIGTELREEGARLITRAALLPRMLDDLTQAYDAVPRCHPERSPGVEYVAGMLQIRHRIAQVQNDHPSEALAMQPGGARPVEHLDDGLEQSRRHLARGGTLRTIYEVSARLDPVTVAFAARSTELGAAIRVLPVPFTRLMIFGRAVAVIPAASDHSSAAFVEDPAVVDFLVRDFELHWRQAEGVNWAVLAVGGAEPTIHEQVGRLLAQGLTQRAIASRLGLSERTIAGHIARLRELYDAETLFQLGWQMRGARTRSGESGG
ncbi:LuxR C-terminal-related transcriptional regulator [Kitasatospora sp. NBC_01300]|uniref:helix-turn-helix transcriptional regulator n=1 Tax=Kitasatospora sp. NBC_01300 TaxID=2903574 RepID=UPI00352F099D|nr:LuxR C-terminal-related transcriptional regulator [Kitasatospora sp. NBC_01300]